MSYIGNEPRFTQFPSKFFNGDGSSQTVTLDYAPPNKAAILVFIAGVRQDTDAYTLTGTSLTFTGTVPSGTNNVQVVHLGLTVQVPAPADGTVTNAKLADMAANTVKVRDANSEGVPSDKAVATTEILIGDGTGFTAAALSSDVTMTNAGAVTIADNAVTLAKMAGLVRGKIIYGDTSGDPAALTVGSSGTALTSDGTDISWGSVGTAWQSVQTTGFTAVAGNGYPCNTTSGTFTATLPASASVGDTIEFIDYAGTWDTSPLSVDPQTLNLKGSSDGTGRFVYERQGVRLVYVDATQGWVAASGINETNPAISSGSYSIDFLVVAGGAGGGKGIGGGGGAGGYRTSTQSIATGTSVITATIGDGGAGAGGTTDVSGSDGSDSSISGTGLTTITSAGGGAGGGYDDDGNDGGSGGGSGGVGSAGGSGNTPVTSPVQGYDGGIKGSSGANTSAGGGGGSSAVGGNGAANDPGDGGAGTASSITGAAVTYAGGGGGSNHAGGAGGGTGGAGGGGDGGNSNASTTAENGTVNLGGGGGGNGYNPPNVEVSGSGGKGVVILSFPTVNYSTVTTGSPTVTTSGDNTILEFTGTGTYTA